MEQPFILEAVIVDEGSDDSSVENMTLMIQVMITVIHSFATEAHKYLISSKRTVHTCRLKGRGHYS